MPQTLTGPWVEDLGDDSETIHGEWLHTVGNLTLSAYNSELWNGPFSSKRSIYRDSNVSMNREICLAESWTRDEIVARGERLAELAVHIWPGPREETSLGLPASASSDVADHDGLYAQYWDAFLFSLQTAGSELSPIATASGDRLKVDIGQESCELAAEISAGSSRVVGLALTLTGPNRYETYRALLRNRAEIEGEVGRWLYWWGRPKEVDSRISMYMAYANPADRSRWPEQHEWLRENLEVMARSFGPRLSGAA